MFREGPEGFLGGLSAANYLRITGTSSATATRDLQDLVAKGALTRTGEKKHTRYALSLESGTLVRGNYLAEFLRKSGDLTPGLNGRGRSANLRQSHSIVARSSWRWSRYGGP
jgi:hypothetical protein